MYIVGLEILDDFVTVHTDAKSSLGAWRKAIENVLPKHFTELKQTFGNVDYVKPYTIFDIGGNKYRVITIISYTTSVTQIEKVMTHQEYNRWTKRQRTK